MGGERKSPAASSSILSKGVSVIPHPAVEMVLLVLFADRHRRQATMAIIPSLGGNVVGAG